MLKWLRAAGEPSRLRLLALCAQATLSVSDLAQALRQSEARVSRHLKILCEAGLLQRLRQGQWVQYRASDATEPGGFLRGLLVHLDRRDRQLSRDLAAVRAAAAPAMEAGGLGESRLGRALAAFATSSGLAPPLDAVLLAGSTHPELLECAARAAQRCSVLVGSRRAAQAARALAERRGFACVVQQASSAMALGPADFARAGSQFGAGSRSDAALQFDAALLDHPPVSGEALGAVLEGAARLLAPAGRLWIFEPYESLESSRERIVEHPLARLRRLLRAAGLVCERLGPVEADGEHVLAALARPSGAARLPVHAGGAQR
jgi:DNA-binding transcriptional ArsR family regulator